MTDRTPVTKSDLENALSISRSNLLYWIGMLQAVTIIIVLLALSVVKDRLG